MSNPPTDEKSEVMDIDLMIRSGGEDISVFEIMQRFRSDGSCEQIVKQALVAAALSSNPTEKSGGEGGRTLAIAWLESIAAETTEERILLAQFLATNPTVKQIQLATSLALEQRNRVQATDSAVKQGETNEQSSK